LIREILDKHAKQLSETHERFGNEIQSAFKSLREEIDPLLTAEQKKQLEGMFAGPPPFRRRPPEGFPFMERPFSPQSELALLQRELDLSEDQAASIRAILEKFESQMESFRAKGPSPEALDSFKQAEEKKQQEIEKILTEDQKEKFRQLRRPQPGRPEGWG
jgi:Spy/CpxP family protein refolding chaperone